MFNHFFIKFFLKKEPINHYKDDIFMIQKYCYFIREVPINMLTKKHIVNIIAIFFMSMLALTCFNKKVYAAGTQNAIDSVPTGLNINQYFTLTTPTAQGANNKYTTNSAYVVNNQILSLTNGVKTVGTAWSDASNYNYIDVTEKQTISGWLYFGDGTSTDLSTNGEGMALVFQNDSRGAHAMGAGAQGLGVYGYDQGIGSYGLLGAIGGETYTNSEKQTILDSSIKNSFAIEFDSQLDDFVKNQPLLVTDASGAFAKRYYSMQGFDSQAANTIPSGLPNSALAHLGFGGGYGHIAATYPGNALTYYQLNTNQTNFSKGYSIYHMNPTSSASLVNDTDMHGDDVLWHHFTVNWTPTDDGKSAKIDYSFNDINIDGEVNTNTSSKLSKNTFIRIDKSITVDLSTFGTLTNNQLMWGFTGSNSDFGNVENKLVSFESIPALLNIEAQTSITDHTLRKTITDSSEDITVAHGDNLTADYDLFFDSGRTSWKDVTATIKIPDNFNVTEDENGNIGTITYADGTTENLQKSEIKDGILIHKLSGQLSTSNKTMRVSINGTADNTTKKDITVEPAYAKFNGSNEISSTSTPIFKIRYKKDWTLNLSTPNDINLIYQASDADLTLPTTLSYSDNNKFLSTDPIIYNIKIGDNTYTAKVDANSTTSTSNGSIPLKDIIDNSSNPSKFWDIFQSNTTQQVEVNAIDKDGITSNTVTYNVHVMPNKSLSINATPNFQFQDTQILDQHKTLGRKDDLNLSVTSYNSVWTLYGEATSLTNSDNGVFNGNIIYKTDTNTYNMYNKLTYIDKDETAEPTEQTKVISDNWSDNTGVLLNQTGANAAGKYSGKITWTLSDSV